MRAKGESKELPKPMTFGDLKHKDLTERKTQLNPDPILSREVDGSDLPSQYTEDVETFTQVLNITDSRDNMPVSSASVWGLNDLAQKQELRPRASPILKETLEKSEQDLKNVDLP